MTFPTLKSFKPFWVVAAITYAATFLWILVLAYTGNLPPQIQQIPLYDKIGHVVLYCVATYLGNRVTQRYNVRMAGLTIPLWILLFGTFTLVEEGAQGFSPNRTLDAVDLIASFAGVILGCWLSTRSHSKD